MRPILKVSGIRFPGIAGVMSDEECRSSLASIAAGGGRPHGDLQVLASGPSIDLNMMMCQSGRRQT
jgi:hypothetical protein